MLCVDYMTKFSYRHHELVLYFLYPHHVLTSYVCVESTLYGCAKTYTISRDVFI